MDDQDHILNTELDEIEKNLNKPTALGITEEELVDTLQVCKNSVEKVFGPLVAMQGNQETIRQLPFQVFLSVLNHVCPRQPSYNLVENMDSDTPPWEEEKPWD